MNLQKRPSPHPSTGGGYSRTHEGGKAVVA
jgi:hypothetical protein